MDTNKILERSISNAVKDYFGNDTYVGDVIMYPFNNNCFEFGIIDRFTPKGMYVVLTSNPKYAEFLNNYKHFLNTTNRLEKAKVEEYEKALKIYRDYCNEINNNKIISKYVFSIIRDNGDPRIWGFCYFKCDSKPGKKISSLELFDFKKSIQKFTKNYSNVTFFSKDYELENTLTDNAICGLNSYVFYDYKKDPNKIYWARPYKDSYLPFSKTKKQLIFEDNYSIQSFEEIFEFKYNSNVLRDIRSEEFCNKLDNLFMKK